ncbi:DNA cytosine methyltransferase, partial [Salmonella enterica]|nr:DNA cytosine methyltransferase [Salmonella enterica subsp. enterica serovar Hadar]EFU5283437.1 DNA cytosine methyltransferase [Salmonella enterica]EHQ0339438.1 DNA cytosine methyltransferase [Salmonella enterica subsp. enterica serovar Chailey]EBV6861271.1 DNA cytosine methyltransferase [Salmonella enterica subsp. enterica serovar Hadar]EBV7517954.1 DNA cytosine methyltransferase [Salmonella enterica subsp. enterica serovar Hadar]
MSKVKVLDTFAGAGGFSLGFHMAGAEIIGAIEVDSWATETFKFNHPESLVIKKDISQFSDEEILETFKNNKPDIILGGPPCQGFSIANKKNGDHKDPRNSLFEEFLRIGRILSPMVMIMENVPNIIKAKTKDGIFVVDIIKEELSSLGYHVYHNILESTDFGVPQIRKRLFIIASRKELKNPFPKPTHNITGSDGLKKTPTLWDAISDLPQINAREGSEEMDYDKQALTDYQKQLRENSHKISNHKAMNHSKRLVERFSSMTWGQSTSDVPEHLKPYKRNSKEISEKVYDQNNRRMHPNKPCHTIAASFYANFVHPYLNRNFTAREGARIQSFPDWYVFKGKPTVVSHKLLQREGREDEKYLCQYNQIGNAVPPLMAKEIALNIFNEVFYN